MRFHCYCCGKSVSSEVPADAVLRAIAVCPECIDAGKVAFAGDLAGAQRVREKTDPGGEEG